MAPIHDAAIDGDLDDVMRLVQEEPGLVNSADHLRMGKTPLQLACITSQMEVACFLLDQGADINARDACGWTALYEACVGGNLEIVQLLMSRGADPAIMTISSTALRPFMIAAAKGYEEVVNYMLRFGVVRASKCIDAQNKRGETALWWAVRKGHMEVVKLLVEAGANPIMADNDGQAPMDIAQLQGYHQCIELLQVSQWWDRGSFHINNVLSFNTVCNKAST